MTPEQKAREAIDQRLIQAGWILQDMRQLNPMAGPGVAVREFPTSTGPVDYALFVDGIPVGVVEAKADEKGENITTVEGQSSRYAGSTFKWVKAGYRIRFAYEATGKLTRFTDYNDQKYRSRRIFSFHRPESLRALLKSEDTHPQQHEALPALRHHGLPQLPDHSYRKSGAVLCPKSSQSVDSDGHRRRQDLYSHYGGISSAEICQDQPSPFPGGHQGPG